MYLVQALQHGCIQIPGSAPGMVFQLLPHDRGPEPVDVSGETIRTVFVEAEIRCDLVSHLDQLI
jgi:hypothetical protein